MAAPASWDPYFTERMNLAQLYHYATLHFDHHRRRLTLTDDSVLPRRVSSGRHEGPHGLATVREPSYRTDLPSSQYQRHVSGGDRHQSTHCQVPVRGAYRSRAVGGESGLQVFGDCR